nr:HD domain-containing protein [uncultured Cohaesibacter sp.]
MKMDEIGLLPMEPERLEKVVTFLQSIEQLKNTLRRSVTSQGRTESTAEHTWRLCMMVLVLQNDLGDVDILKLFKICLIHDLGETLSGDVPAVEQSANDGRHDRERADLITLCAPLPEDIRVEILQLWEEYEASETKEAILAKGLDKLETVFQHGIGQNPSDFNYAFNLDYGRSATDRHALTRQMRELADNITRAKMPD